MERASFVLSVLVELIQYIYNFFLDADFRDMADWVICDRSTLGTEVRVEGQTNSKSSCLPSTQYLIQMLQVRLKYWAMPVKTCLLQVLSIYAD